jgi:hypothetical protein
LEIVRVLAIGQLSNYAAWCRVRGVCAGDEHRMPNIVTTLDHVQSISFEFQLASLTTADDSIEFSTKLNVCIVLPECDVDHSVSLASGWKQGKRS